MGSKLNSSFSHQGSFKEGKKAKCWKNQHWIPQKHWVCFGLCLGTSYFGLSVVRSNCLDLTKDHITKAICGILGWMAKAIQENGGGMRDTSPAAVCGKGGRRGYCSH